MKGWYTQGVVSAKKIIGHMPHGSRSASDTFVLRIVPKNGSQRIGKENIIISTSMKVITRTVLCVGRYLTPMVIQISSALESVKGLLRVGPNMVAISQQATHTSIFTGGCGKIMEDHQPVKTSIARKNVTDTNGRCYMGNNMNGNVRIFGVYAKYVI